MKPSTVEISPVTTRELVRAVGSRCFVLTRKGKPVAYVLPADTYDEEDIGYMTDSAFWKMINERRQEEGGVSLEEIEAEITRAERAERAQRRPRTKAGSRSAGSAKKKAS
jgi:PHD/YefM family antitoxin component YafN of YafNO toxin-antitoxin module